MCGIAGAFWPQTQPSEECLAGRLRPVLNALARRGPDGEGMFVDPAAGVVLGHRRLAIQDLTPAAAQPFRSPTGRWVLTFNGEIYNYRELAARLAAPRDSTGDTAVLAAALDAWGWERTLAEIDAMFALAAWDTASRQLYLARDRFGEKPLVYAEFGGGFYFASDLRALSAWPGFPSEPDLSCRGRFAETGYLAAPDTVYRAARKLSPAHWLVVTPGALGGGIRVSAPIRFWSPAAPAAFSGTRADAVAELDFRLAQAVASRRAADVPVGLFLSGGLDTAAIASAAPDLPAFTLGIADPYLDESHEAGRIAARLGLRQQVARLDEKTAVALASELTSIYDEPFADSSQIPTLAACRLAARSVKVVLTGDGGDELFGGYPRYGYLAWASAAPSWVRRGAALALRTLGEEEKARMLGRATPAGDLAALYSAVMGGGPTNVTGVRPDDPLGWMGLHDLQHYLPNDLLVKVDRAAMSCGLETRLPMLDPRLVQLALSLPPAWKRDKAILAAVLRRRLPSFARGPKRGFQAPIWRWLLGPLRDWAQALVDRTDCVELAEQWRSHLKAPQRRCVTLWSHLIWEDWLRRRVSVPPPDRLRSAPTVLRA